MHNIFIKSLYERPFIKFRYEVFDQSYIILRQSATFSQNFQFLEAQHHAVTFVLNRAAF